MGWWKGGSVDGIVEGCTVWVGWWISVDGMVEGWICVGGMADLYKSVWMTWNCVNGMVKGRICVWDGGGGYVDEGNRYWL